MMPLQRLQLNRKSFSDGAQRAVTRTEEGNKTKIRRLLAALPQAAGEGNVRHCNLSAAELETLKEMLISVNRASGLIQIEAKAQNYVSSRRGTKTRRNFN